MKALTILISSLIGVSAIACPNLAGDYSCTIGGVTSPLKVTQSTRDGVQTYITKGPAATFDYVADNKSKTTITKDSFSKNVRTAKSSCEGQILKVTEATEFFRIFDGLKIGTTQNRLLILRGIETLLFTSANGFLNSKAKKVRAI